MNSNLTVKLILTRAKNMMAKRRLQHKAFCRLRLHGLQLFSAFLSSGRSKHFTILPNHRPFLHPFLHTFTHRRRSQPCKATANSSAAVKVRSLAQGLLDTSNGLATFRLQVTPLYLLSHGRPVWLSSCLCMCRCVHACLSTICSILLMSQRGS